MVTFVTGTRPPEVRSACQISPRPIRIALLGLGRIGAAVARHLDAGGAHRAVQVVSALVRDDRRSRDVPLQDGTLVTADADAVFARRPDVLVELLGGVDPAFTLVARALTLGIPVVTANKSLLAERGPELDALAAGAGVPLLYEASVLAGVPFLGTLARRPVAGSVARVEGILNGTSNFVLGRVADGIPMAAAVAEAQRLGFAEPDPHADVMGIDAAQKLAVLLRHVGWGQVAPGCIETSGIEVITPDHLEGARELGGYIKPLVAAARTGGRISAFSGPVFVPHAHRLSRVAGVENAVVLSNASGEVTFSGPGAGPDVTAATVIDDVLEAADGRRHTAPPSGVAVECREYETGWFVRTAAAGSLPSGEDVADLLGSHGIWMRRSVRFGNTAFLLTYRAPKAHVDRALGALAAAAGTTSLALRALED